MSTVNTRKVHECRNSWHSEWWPAKVVLWLGLTAVTFLAPSTLVQLYGQSPADHLGSTTTLLFISSCRLFPHDVADDAGVRSSDLCRKGRTFRSRVCACISFSWFQTFRVLQFTIQIPYRTCVLTCLGIKREQGVPGDPAHQRDQVHHVAQRLLPVGDHPEEMVGSLALFCFPVAAHRPSDAVI